MLTLLAGLCPALMALWFALPATLGPYNFAFAAGAVVGGTLRTVGPFLIRWWNTREPFDFNFLKSAAVNQAAQVTGGGFVFPTLSPTAGWAEAFGWGLAFGYIGQDWLREIEKWLPIKLTGAPAPDEEE